MPNNPRLYSNPDPIVPGQKYDWTGVEDYSREKIYRLLRKIETGKLGFESDGSFDVFFTSDPNDNSGAQGLHIVDTDTTDGLPLTITFSTMIDGAESFEWEIGMDYDVINGRRDFVLLYDHTANSSAGADILRISHEADSDDADTCKWAFGRFVGTPRNQNFFMMLDGGDDTTELGGLLVRHFGGATANSISVVTRATANNRTAVSFGDATETFWVNGSDLAAVNDKHYYWYDAVNAQTRMFIRSLAGAVGQNGFGTTNPQGVVSAGGSSAVTTRQRYFIGSTTDDPGSRSINIEAIRDATVANTVNYVWLMGGLGGPSTAASRVATSSGSSLGLEGTDTLLSVVVAGTGSNQTILRPLQFTNAGATTLNFDTTLADGVDFILNTSTGSKIGTATTQKLAFFNSTPIVQPANTTDLRQALIDLGLYATGGATPLDLNGGNLTVNAATINADSTLGDGVDLILGSTNGTMVGTASSQKLAFWGAAPVVRPAAYTPTNVVADRSYDADTVVVAELADVVGTLIADLQSIGIIG